MDLPNRLRIVLLGKTGSGKSSLANTMMGKDAFRIRHFSASGPSFCQVESGSINGKHFTLVDTPGFIHPGMSEGELRREIQRSTSEVAPGPHAFLIVLKVEKFTEQESQIIQQIQECFSDEVFRYSTVVFTGGDQLPEEIEIQVFVRKNKDLKALVEKCGGRCLVFDNKYWNHNQQDDCRNNQVQVAKLLDVIQKMVVENRGACYTTEMLENWKQQQSVFYSILKCVRALLKKTPAKIVLCVMVLIGVTYFLKGGKNHATEIM